MLRALHERIEENCARRGLLYPWWVPATSFVGQVVCVVAALGLRDALWSFRPVTLTVLLVLASPIAQFGFRKWLPWWLDGLGAALAAGWLFLVPIDGTGVIDLAPSLLALITAEAVARDGLRPGAAVGGISLAMLVVAGVGPGVPGFPVHVLEVLLGFVVGAMLLWQMRALTAERKAREGAWQQATTVERERIAREIHDLVAHSLSVSLLHVTGARHALRDVRDGEAPTDDAVAEVDAALADAEQVGRRAMADIRRTVSAMANGTSTVHALPGAPDIAALVREVDLAGLTVQYDEQGDPGQLPAAAGLGLYRIAQESLANVAKHAPGSTARVQLSVSPRTTRLVVRNALNGSRGRRTDGLGSGLAGMQARAAQLGASLTAGPDGDDWLVEVRLDPARRDGRIELPCGHSVPGFGRISGATP